MKVNNASKKCSTENTIKVFRTSTIIWISKLEKKIGEKEGGRKGGRGSFQEGGEDISGHKRPMDQAGKKVPKVIMSLAFSLNGGSGFSNHSVETNPK